MVICREKGSVEIRFRGECRFEITSWIMEERASQENEKFEGIFPFLQQHVEGWI